MLEGRTLALLLCGCTSGASSADAAPDDAGEEAPATTGPIDAPFDRWTWIDFPDSRCAHGQPSGLGVNPHAGATRTVIHLEGGGACWNADNCWIMPTAQHLDGHMYGGEQAQMAIFARGMQDNPFRDANYVYVPYCTGDVHIGSATVDFDVNGTKKTTYFWGAKNMDLFLARLVPTFPRTERVILTGISAGGYGAYLNLDRVRQAFGVRVDVIDDSGPPFDAPSDVASVADGGAPKYAPWGVVYPKGCTGCKLLSDIYPFNRKADPKSRFAFLTYHEDTSISVSYKVSLGEYAMLIDGFQTNVIAPDPNAASLIVKTMPAHGVQLDWTVDATLIPWLARMEGDDPSWTSLTYP